MKRRTLLMTLGASLLGSAGCLGASSGGDNNTTQQTTEPSPTQRTESTPSLRSLNTTTGEATDTPVETGLSTARSTESPTSQAYTRQTTTSPVVSSTTGLEQPPTQQTPLETETPANVGQVEGASWSAEESPQITGRIGKRSQLEEGDRPHLIQIWNDASTTRTIHFSLAPIDSPKRPIFEVAYQLKADSYANLKLMISSDFVANAGVSAESTRLVAKIPSDLVDCNESSTYIVARSDGTFDWSYFTTDMGCELMDTTTDGTTT